MVKELKKVASQASFQSSFKQRSDKLNENLLFQANYVITVYASRSDGSKTFTALFFRALERSNLNTTHQSTVELASVAKLTKCSLRSPIKGRKHIFHITRRDTESALKTHNIRANRDRASPEFVESSNCEPIALGNIYVGYCLTDEIEFRTYVETSLLSTQKIILVENACKSLLNHLGRPGLVQRLDCKLLLEVPGQYLDELYWSLLSRVMTVEI